VTGLMTLPTTLFLFNEFQLFDSNHDSLTNENLRVYQSNENLIETVFVSSDENPATTFYPTNIGQETNDTLTKSFPQTLDVFLSYASSAFWQYSSLNNNITDGAGNTLTTAREIGLLDSLPIPKTFSDWVGSSDQLDYYRFELLSNSNFQLTLNGLSADANVFLLDSLGRTIASSINRNSSPESLNQDLDSGTYYILVRTNRNIPSAATNYNLTVSAEYIVDDILVSNPEVGLADPEFDSSSNQMVWQANSAAGNGSLRVAPVDPNTGFLILEPNTIQVIDNGIPSLGAIENGPEWAYGDRLKIVYNQQVNNQIVIKQAEWNGTSWTTDFVTDAQGMLIEGISLLTHQDRNFGMVSYLRDIQVGGKSVRISGWADLDNPGVGGLLPGERRRWVEGERSILLTREVGAYEQLFKYDVDTGRLKQLTFDPTDKVGDAYMFKAPEFNNELIFMVAETTIDNSLRPNQHSIYRNLNGQWTKIKTVVSPVAELPIVTGHEPFVFDGHSYIAFNISKGGANGERILDGTQEVWFASVGTGTDDLLRRVSSEVGTINSDKIPDPEPFVTPDNAFIYYSTSEVVGGASTIHRTDTGLGSGVDLFTSAISTFTL
jgi:hypothetical protein